MRNPSRPLPEMPVYLAIIPIVITVSLLALQLIAFNRFDPQPPLMFGIFIAAAIGVMRGWKWTDIEEGMFKIVIISLPAIAILLLIGILIGSWVASGTVPYMIYYGLQIISPQWFLVSGFILCSLMSLALGTSWGTTGTLGIVVVGIGSSLGFPLWLSAAAVISGAFFGDKMSPISDTTNLAPAITGNNVYAHIKNMIPTTFPAMIIGLIVYLVIGYTFKTDALEPEELNHLLGAIDGHFKLSIMSMIPPVVVLFMAIRGHSAIPSMFGGVISALVLAFAWQGLSLGGVFDVILAGFFVETGNEIANNIFNRGGIESMTDTVSLVFFALTFGGILEQLGCFKAISSFVLKKIKRFWQLQASAISGTFFMVMGTGDAYLPMAFIGRLFSQAYDKFGFSRLNLSRAIEEGGTLMTPLVPWSASGIFVGAALGLGIREGNFENLLYIPLAVGCWLSPLLGMIFPMFGWFSKKSTPEELASYADTEEPETQVSQPLRTFLKWYKPPVSAYIASPEVAFEHQVQDIRIPTGLALENGDTGFVRIDGEEAIVLDKKILCYNEHNHVKKDCHPESLDSANLTHFTRNFDETIENARGKDIRQVLPNILPSENIIYALKIRAEFAEIHLKAAKGNNNVFKNISGTLCGFYYPDYLKNITGHSILFFVSDDNTIAGKLLESQTIRAHIDIQQICKLNTGLPLTTGFLTMDIKKND